MPLRSRLGPAWVRTERWDCTPMTRFPMSRCTQPVEQQPTKRIVLVGDSNLQQLAGALNPTARSHGCTSSRTCAGPARSPRCPR